VQLLSFDHPVIITPARLNWVGLKYFWLNFVRLKGINCRCGRGEGDDETGGEGQRLNQPLSDLLVPKAHGCSSSDLAMLTFNHLISKYVKQVTYE